MGTWQRQYALATPIPLPDGSPLAPRIWTLQGTLSPAAGAVSPAAVPALLLGVLGADVLRSDGGGLPGETLRAVVGCGREASQSTQTVSCASGPSWV
mmetsp:Transcript_177777/g.432547  ORF Transcript_177777/g.432547 Transcript_177777/m.432547 type:complete len:97 (-) Transcript_177777:67-357(-)